MTQSYVTPGSFLFSALHLHRWDPDSHDPGRLQSSEPYTNVPGDNDKEANKNHQKFHIFLLTFLL